MDRGGGNHQHSHFPSGGGQYQSRSPMTTKNSNAATMRRRSQQYGGGEEDCARSCAACSSVICCATCCGVNYGAWWGCSIVVWVLLWIFATTYGEGEQRFTLQLGETLRIAAPPLWSRTSFGIQSATTNPGVEVYAFSPVIPNYVAECPYTNGPSLTVQQHQTIQLEKEEYQYDFFHLNAGSVISLSADLQSGATNIFLLQGIHVLNALRHDDDWNTTSYQNFRGHSMLKQFMGNRGQTSFRYEVPTPDFYILVYDSAYSSGITQFSMTLKIDRSTHYLQNYQPICGPHTTASEEGCRWPLDNDNDRQRMSNSCIIVKAVSSDTDEQQRRHEHPQVVIVQLESTIGSIHIIWIAALPLLVGLLLVAVDCGKKNTTCSSCGGKHTATTAMHETSSLLQQPSETNNNSNNNSYQATSASPQFEFDMRVDGYNDDVPMVMEEDVVVPLKPPV